MAKRIKELKEGDILAINGKSKRGHFIVVFRVMQNDVLVFDTLNADIFKIDKTNALNAMQHIVGHPKHDDIKMLDLIENLPEDVYEVVKANAEERVQRVGMDRIENLEVL